MNNNHSSNGKEIRAAIFIGIFLLMLVLYPMFRADQQFIGEDNGSMEPSVVVRDLDLSVLHAPPFTELQQNVTLDYARQEQVAVGNPLQPAAPFDVTVLDLALGHSVYISWQAPPDISLTGFRIYRSSEQFRQGQLLAEISDGKQLYYYDQTATDNQRYYYLVRSRNAAGLESVNSEQIVGIATDSSAPYPPSEVVFRSDPQISEVMITWKNPTDQDFSFVRVYRSERLGETGTIVADNIVTEKFQDTLDPEKTYYYILTAVDTAGNESLQQSVLATSNRNIFEPLSAPASAAVETSSPAENVVAE